MDGRDRKRKKSDTADLENVERRVKKEATAMTTPPPTEEEVDEFFTILNRMRSTVKYLKNNKVGESIIPALEVPPPPDEEVVVDVKVGDNNCVLDLNSIPDEGESD
ncbi:hypothetical protein DCAR_0312842 [Daucus carota subsp. sativus]|uniref:Uncharacterized protein n=1 Tax=Daucus carota subsp. sativus TaxID=79200 RepID=A0A161Y0E3_DAUCS|nr:hypothetical protein DCAR_0312842 [Daucus carota subsp. sativus]